MGCAIVGFILFFILLIFSVSPVFGTILLIILISVAIYIAFLDGQKQQKEIEDKTSKLKELKDNLSDFLITEEYKSYDLESSILLDEERKKMCIISLKDSNSDIFTYQDILESEIIEDGITVTKTSRSSQLGGALLGGVLAGGVGAIIGGLSGSTTSTNEVNSIDLKIIVNDTKTPIHIINFLNADVIDFNGKPFPVKKSDDKYKNAIEKANYWQSLISVLIKKADKEDKEKEKETISVNNKNNNSVADEIKKLNELVKEGIISEEEFNNQKNKLLT